MMDFCRVIEITNRAPDGWDQKLTLEQYALLDSERRNHYKPLYARYRQVKRREYDEYGKFIGWEPYPVGIGEPVGYEYVGYLAARAIDDVLRSNVVAARILGR